MLPCYLCIFIFGFCPESFSNYHLHFFTQVARGIVIMISRAIKNINWFKIRFVTSAPTSVNDGKWVVSLRPRHIYALVYEGIVHVCKSVLLSINYIGTRPHFCCWYYYMIKIRVSKCEWSEALKIIKKAILMATEVNIHQSGTLVEVITTFNKVIKLKPFSLPRHFYYLPR